MKAMTLDAYGLTPSVKDLPLPTPQAGQVRVKVKVTSINPVDWKQAAGMFKPILKAKFPNFVPGYDVAGEVDEVGAGVTAFKKGQRVHTRLVGNGAGACAEYVLAAQDTLAAVPEKMDFEQAAGLPLAGMTALQALRDGAKLPLQGATQRVLVVGASGGVGHLVIQLAKSFGATVVGVCSGKNAATVKSLGASDVLDYTQPIDWQKAGLFDVVIDCVGVKPSEYFPRMTANGHFVSCVPAPATMLQAALNVFRQQKVAVVMLKPNATDLQTLNSLFEKGGLKVLIDSRFPLEKLASAWERSRSGRAVGKIVVEVG